MNAGGSVGATLFDRAGRPHGWPLLKAMNLVTSRPARKAALVAPTRAGRALVLLPWQGRTLVGTSESADARQPDDQDARRGEVAAFLADVNATFPRWGSKLTKSRSCIAASSLRPPRMASCHCSGHSRIIDHASGRDLPELISIVGVKYTTARVVAERAVDLVLQETATAVRRHAGRRSRPCPAAAGRSRCRRSGGRMPCSEEMAHTLIDVVVRRTGLGAAGLSRGCGRRRCASADAEDSWLVGRRKLSELAR